MIKKVALVVGAGVFALVLQTPTLAWAVVADNIMPTSRFSGCSGGGYRENSSGGPCLTDNASTGWWAEREIDWTTSASDTSAETQINASMSRSYNGTDLNTYYDTTFTDRGSGETDVVYRSRPADFDGANTVGYYFCDDPVSGGKCDQGYVNLRRTDWSPAYMRAVVCHETGHAVGLLHPTDATPAKSRDDARFECMMNSPVATHYGLGPDPNVANINSVY
jgi:hypothetical protein